MSALELCINTYRCSALRMTGTISRAMPPPIRAVMSCGQLKVAGRAFSIGSFSVPAASRDGAITPQTTFTTMRYSTANFAQRGNEPRGDLLTDLPAVRTGDQPQQDHKHGVADHDGGKNKDLRRDAQQVGEHRGEHGHDDAAAHSGGQHGNGQHSVDAGAGDELTKALGQRLQSDEKRQHNGGFR